MTSAITHFSCELLSDISQFVTVGSIGEVLEFPINIDYFSNIPSGDVLYSTSYGQSETGTRDKIISMAIHLPSTDSRRVVVSYKRKNVHEVMVNRSVKLAKVKRVIR